MERIKCFKVWAEPKLQGEEKASTLRFLGLTFQDRSTMFEAEIKVLPSQATQSDSTEDSPDETIQVVKTSKVKTSICKPFKMDMVPSEQDKSNQKKQDSEIALLGVDCQGHLFKITPKSLN